MQTKDLAMVESKALKTSGRLLKVARLNDEYYVPIGDPAAFISKMTAAGIKADLFTFVQELHDPKPKYPFRQEWDSMAVLPLTTYEHWFGKQINFKPRNKIRKAQKNGVETRRIEFTDDLVKGIMEIYNETPIRQGKRNWHYAKDFETVKREHQTFLERSDFIGAFHNHELIGFAKVTNVEKCSILMNIVARIAHRDKAPTNALIAKTVEVCAGRGSSCLNYGVWGRRGLNDLKVASGFERVEIPRYFVPLTFKGRLALKLNLHHRLVDYVPERCILLAAALRGRWNDFRYQKRDSEPGDKAAGTTVR